MYSDRSNMRLSLYILAGCLAVICGCSSLKAKLGGKPVAQEPAAYRVTSALDSLCQAGLPVDTVILEQRRLEDYTPTDDTAIYRRGPSSVELGVPAKIRGYRVQLASSDRVEDLEAIVQRVEREFSTRVYLEEQDGRYALRIGSFIRLNQARAEKERAISYGYKHAWVVQTDISFHEIQHKE